MKATGVRIIGADRPGPGNYKTSKGMQGAKYTMRAKTLNPYSYTTQRSVPGPGQYEAISGVTSDGKQYWSKYKSSRCRKISPSKIDRFQLSGKGIPGPGIYSIKPISLNNKGSYFVSKYKSSLGKSFGSSKRPGIAQFKSYPGPGMYAIPSDFPVWKPK